MSNEEILEQNAASATDEQAAEAASTDESAVEAGEQPTVEELQAKLEQAEQKAMENWDQLLRTKAEMDNLRRRTEKDLENAHKFAIEKFVTELLAVKDSLELGLNASQQEAASVESLREGMELTLNMLGQVFDKFNVVELNPEGEKFNPDHHQAMSTQETADQEPNTVMMVMQKGYLLNDRLVRPAMVTVARAPEDS